jgi:ferredoxin-NADP reductase
LARESRWLVAMAVPSTTTSTETLESRLSSLQSSPARVVANVVENAVAHRLTLDVTGHSLAATYVVAGQFAAVGAQADDLRYFALASPMSASPMVELLVAPNHEVSAALCALAPGQTVWLSAALGDGFGLENTGASELVVFVTGTGIAAVRPIIADFGYGRPSRSLTVYYSERPGVRHAFGDEVAAWRARGVRVELLGGEQADNTFVQDAWSRDVLRPPATDAHYIVVGAPAMQQAVLAVLSSAGVPPEKVHFNY